MRRREASVDRRELPRGDSAPRTTLLGARRTLEKSCLRSGGARTILRAPNMKNAKLLLSVLPFLPAAALAVACGGGSDNLPPPPPPPPPPPASTAAAASDAGPTA